LQDFDNIEIEDLIKRKIVSIYNRPQVMVHNIFFVQKTNGDQRLIINLKKLNRYLRPVTFRMLTLSQFSRTFRDNYWFCSCDIADAYYHINILPEFRKYFAFYYNNHTLCFNRLPFGLATGPFLFT